MYLGKVSVAHAGVDKFLRTAKSFFILASLVIGAKLDREFSISKVLIDAHKSNEETTSLEETVVQSTEIKFPFSFDNAKNYSLQSKIIQSMRIEKRQEKDKNRKKE